MKKEKLQDLDERDDFLGKNPSRRRPIKKLKERPPRLEDAGDSL